MREGTCQKGPVERGLEKKGKTLSAERFATGSDRKIGRAIKGARLNEALISDNH